MKWQFVTIVCKLQKKLPSALHTLDLQHFTSRLLFNYLLTLALVSALVSFISSCFIYWRGLYLFIFISLVYYLFIYLIYLFACQFTHLFIYSFTHLCVIIITIITTNIKIITFVTFWMSSFLLTYYLAVASLLSGLWWST